MIPVCFIAETLPPHLRETVQEHSLTRVAGIFEAASKFQENPETIFLFLMKSESETLEFLNVFLKSLPSAKIVLLAGVVSSGFETQVMAAGASDILSHDLSFSDLMQRVEKIGSCPKKNPRQGTMDSILIVDDDQGVRNFLSLVFKKKGFETILAESGQQAITAVREGSPSVVLLDMMMPEMDGLETLKRLREINPNLGVVMATGLCDEVLAQKAMQLGAYAYVVKPFDLPYLEMVVLTRLCFAI